jgi:hypothetical protein
MASYHTRCYDCDRLLVDEDGRYCHACEPQPDPAEEARIFWDAAQRLAARTSLPTLANHSDCMELVRFQEQI